MRTSFPDALRFEETSWTGVRPRATNQRVCFWNALVKKSGRVKQSRYGGTQGWESTGVDCVRVHSDEVFIELRLENGTAGGVVEAYKPGGVATALKCARSDYPTLRQRNELLKVCVYLLIQSRDRFDASGHIVTEPRLYVGMAEIAQERLNNHLTNKEFWAQLILFTSNSTRFNGSHAKYIESELLKLARQTKRTNLQNTANSRPPSLSPGDVQFARAMLAEIIALCPLLGVEAFESGSLETAVHNPGPPLAGLASPRMEESVAIQPAADGAIRVRMRQLRRPVYATGVFANNQLKVLAGSKGPAVPTTRPEPDIQKRREELIQEGVLRIEGEFIVFVSDFAFRTPSAAAVVLVGARQNGWIEWVDDSGQSLDQIVRRRNK